MADKKNKATNDGDQNLSAQVMSAAGVTDSSAKTDGTGQPVTNANPGTNAGENLGSAALGTSTIPNPAPNPPSETETFTTDTNAGPKVVNLSNEGPAANEAGGENEALRQGTGIGLRTAAEEILNNGPDNDYRPKINREMIEHSAKEATTEELELVADVTAKELQSRKGTPETQAIESNDAAALHSARVKQYGEGYIVAKHGEKETVFSSTAWGMLPAGKDGWKEVLKTPPEVANLNK